MGRQPLLLVGRVCPATMHGATTMVVPGYCMCTDHGDAMSDTECCMEQVLISFKQSTAAMLSSTATAHAEVPKGELVVYMA